VVSGGEINKLVYKLIEIEMQMTNNSHVVSSMLT